MNLVMSPKLENLCNSNFLNISILMCYSLVDHEPSTMYLSNYLLQGITWEHRSRGSFGDFLETTTCPRSPQGKVEGIWQIKGRKFSYPITYPLYLAPCL